MVQFQSPQEYLPHSQQQASQFRPGEMHDELTKQIKTTSYLRHPTFHGNCEVWEKQTAKKKLKPALFHSEGQVGVSHQILYGQKSPIL